MKKIIGFLFAFSVLAVGSVGTASADDVDKLARVRFQASGAEEGKWAPALVVELPSVTTDATNVLGLVGVDHVGKHGSVALMVGGEGSAGDAKLVLDARGVFGCDSVLGWYNLRWNNVADPDVSTIYAMGMLDFPLHHLSNKLDFMAVGVESENTFILDDSVDHTLSLGPNVLVDVGDHVQMQVAYQAHRNGDNQAWARLQLSL